jgi:hypothetical protein
LADAALLAAHWGQRGPGVTYFEGDSTLDQVVSLADGKVFARFYGQPIAGSGTLADQPSAGAPIVRYHANGRLSLDVSGTMDPVWGLRLNFGATTLVVNASMVTCIHGSWTNASLPTALEFGDPLFGVSGRFAAGGEKVFVRIQPGLKPADFGPVEYFFGQGETVSSASTTVQILPSGSKVRVY